MQETQIAEGNILAKEETIQINKKELKQKASKFFNNKKIFNQTTLTIVLILVLMFTAFHVRSYSLGIPATEDWAKTSVESNIKSQMDLQIRTQRADLPEASIAQLVETQYSDYYSKNKQSVDSQIQQISAMYKDEMRDDKGTFYLSDIDSYLWYSYSKWYEKNGYFGTEEIDGQKMFGLRDGRLGQEARFITTPFITNQIHSMIKIFNPAQDVMTTSALRTAILMALVVIPAFFIGRKFGGTIGGTIAGALIAVMPAIVSRTVSPDDDYVTFLFPLLMFWFFIEAIESKNLKQRLIWSSLIGFTAFWFMRSWSGWWFTFDFIIGAVFVFVAYLLMKHYMKHKKIHKKTIWEEIKSPVQVLSIFLISAFLFTIILSPLLGENPGSSLNNLITSPLQPLNFVFGFKAAGDAYGSTSYALWPSVFTTVAELNPGSYQQSLTAGGGLLFVLCGLVGALLLLFNKKEGTNYPLYGIILIPWMLSTYYASLVGIRFTALFAPTIAFGVTALAGYIFQKTNKGLDKSSLKNITKTILKTAVVLLMLFLFVFEFVPQAYAISKSNIPSYNDAWEETMLTIKNDSDKGIITSWWDFGHWFQARSERTVTFDGGDQGKRIYWVGKTLLTDEEDEALDILKMLNCGQEESYNLLENYSGDRYKTTILHEKITRETRIEAEQTLLDSGLTAEQTQNVLDYSHCEDLWPMYYITSEDMVGKAGVWGHFGSWNFSKAYNYYKLKNMPANLAIQEAQEVLGYSAEQAKQEYLEVQSINDEKQANDWISPWPQYVTQTPVSCVQKTDVLDCSYNIRIGINGNAGIYVSKAIINLTSVNESFLIIKAIDLTTGSLVSQSSAKPTGITIYDGQKITSTTFSNSQFTQDVLVYKDGTGYSSLVLDPLLTDSMFTKLFFLNGKGLEHFKKMKEVTSFRGEKIILWKVEP
ncbi:hypothetical protein COV13_00255 [Candidatus Woesearchaeota archaeon CG10_big_fil_rev_8_21_14_0_10_32_9]|nr:MAG: hypothetical protein COV13_00255 [Candidatus Woesearchaeota archaeon CG10_big_fil_rev_8_21_14_0_10_32_9]